MKKAFLLIRLLCILFPAALAAQAPENTPCENPDAQINLEGNGLLARILSAGDFGWDLSGEAVYWPNFDINNPGPPVATIFLGGLWYGGLDPVGNLKLKATTYRSGGKTSFYAGPLDPATGTTNPSDCHKWDRFFEVSSTAVNDFLADLADGSLSGTHHSVRGWPGRGNPFFSDVWGYDLPFTSQPLAPFHDEDGDGLYNPMAGDYPVVKLQGLEEFVPDQQIWLVTNDQGGGGVDSVTGGLPLQAEIQITYFVFNCPDNPLLNNAMFTSHKLIHYGSEPVDSFSLAMYVDFDLGCYTDDYLGCHPATNTFYTYNRTNNDQSISACGLANAFGLNPPVQAVTFLNKSLDRFMPIYNTGTGNPPAATTHPQSPVEYFNYLHGHWRNGLPLTYGLSGYTTNSTATPTTHAFPGNPNIASEWSMKSTNQPGRDQRGLAIHEVGTLVPGQILELNTAWSYHRGDSLDYLGNVNLMLGEVPHLLDLYAGNFAGVCAPFVSAKSPASASAMRIWPNPASTAFYVHLPDASSGIAKVFNQTGILMAAQPFEGTELLAFDCGTWPKGIYFLQISDGKSVLSRSIAVTR